MIVSAFPHGATVEPEKFLLTNGELAREFGAVSFFPEALQGMWIHQGQTYADQNVRLFVDKAKEKRPENLCCFVAWLSQFMCLWEKRIPLPFIPLPIPQSLRSAILFWLWRRFRPSSILNPPPSANCLRPSDFKSATFVWHWCSFNPVLYSEP
ncbi:MAG: hypothetical protein P4N59_04760 [Negativicutes bacterium]|nr:hypothetical protein [Negativicutes bacterium]